MAGASSDLKNAGAELATRISTFFRFVATPLALKHGGGESGLARFLKEAAARIKADPKARFDEDECRFIDSVLSQASNLENGRPARAGQRQNAGANPSQTLGWFDSLDGFGSLDRAADLQTPNLACVDGQTIRSQASQSYTQWVPLHDADGAQTICPIGHSDRRDSPFRTSTLSSWGQGGLHPAPLSRPAVDRITAQHLWLSKSDLNRRSQ